MTETIIIPVILCGGSGTRLWPVSREHQPKQFLNLTGDFSLLQDTMHRAMRTSGAAADSIVTVTLDKLKNKVASHLTMINPLATRHILPEPCARNTAAAVAFAASYVRDVFGKDAIMWILPADHYIGNEQALASALQKAIESAKENNLVTFGICPSRAETGYGYIRLGPPSSRNFVYTVDQFVEKPDFQTACAYVASGRYLWNSGMFVFKAETVLDEFREHAPDILAGVSLAMDAAEGTGKVDPEIYATLPEQPFDKAIMENSSRVMTVACDPDWSDIGSWESLWEIRSKDSNGNVIEGRTACHDTYDCLILAKNRLVATAGLENIVVVEMDDAILIADRNNADAMRSLMQALKKSGAREISVPSSPPGFSPVVGDGHFISSLHHYKETAF